jgi:hypothetical protein
MKAGNADKVQSVMVEEAEKKEAMAIMIDAL